jgi:hypothetical protein
MGRPRVLNQPGFVCLNAALANAAVPASRCMTNKYRYQRYFCETFQSAPMQVGSPFYALDLIVIPSLLLPAT